MHGIFHIVHLIIWLIQNKVTRSGSVTRKVQCENCTLCFEYELRRTVKLRGEASEEALAREAERRLRKHLAEECDPVPCPSCGWYQQHMVERVRREATRRVPAWMAALLIVTALSITSAILLTLPPQRFGPVGAGIGLMIGAVGAAGAAVLVLFIVHRLHRRFAYNPNGTRWRNEEQQERAGRD